MKRPPDEKWDDENLEGADQGGDPAGDEEDVFCEARPVDLRAGRSAGFSVRRSRLRRHGMAERKRAPGAAERKAARLSGSAGGKAGHDARRGCGNPGKASGQFSLVRKSAA